MNLVVAAGGRGRETLQTVKFRDEPPTLHMSGYPPLRYSLESPYPPPDISDAASTASVVGRWGPLTLEQTLMDALLSSTMPTPEHGHVAQQLLIANFPPHYVSRREEDWEWVIANDNVTFISSGPDGKLLFDERNFQTATSHESSI